MRDRGTVRLATRGSALAMRQASAVKAALEDRRYAVELVEVETTGDQLREELIHRLGTTGAFVRSLDEEVLDGDVDGAVHSMKDMPTESPDELIVAGIPERADPGDVLVTPDGSDLDGLPAGARVGTASLRRRAQLLAVRPDLEVAPLRGNVDTRVEKLLAPSLHREHQRRLDAEEADENVDEAAQEADEAAQEADEAAQEADENGDEDAQEADEWGDADAEEAGGRGDMDDDTQDGDPGTFERTAAEWFDDLAEVERRALERRPDEAFDAVVLAAAGLARLGLDRDVPTEPLPVAGFVPSPGQGAVAVTALDGTDASEAIHEVVDHPRTRVETTVERVILAELGGGCVAPIGVHAVVQGDQVRTRVQVLSVDGDEAVEAARDLPVRTYAEAASEFADDLRGRGAADLVEAAEAATGGTGGTREERDAG